MSGHPPVVLAEWESGRRAPVDVLSEVDRQLATTLREADGGRLIVDERRDGVWISAKSWVGVVRFTDFEVRVVPKLHGGNLGVVRMLDYASGVNALRRYDAARELEAVGDDLIELIAWLFADATMRIVRDGLLSDYVSREDTLHALRGRLRVLAQVQQRFGRVDPLEVAFDEFESDIPENQVLAAALDATRSIVRTPLVQRPIRRLHSIFHEAADPSGIDALETLRGLAYTRRNEHYRAAHSLRRPAAPPARGTRSLHAWRDTIVCVPARHERPVRAIRVAPRRRGVGTRRRPSAGSAPRSLHREARHHRPDVLGDHSGPVAGGTLPGRLIRLPVDAKYKLYDQKKLNEADVYQAFFYAFAYAAETDRRRDLARAVILYPRSGDAADAALRVETHMGTPTAKIQAFGIDIDAALAAISAGTVTAEALPSIGRLRQVFRDVVADVSGEDRWRLASSA